MSSDQKPPSEVGSTFRVSATELFPEGVPATLVVLEPPALAGRTSNLTDATLTIGRNPGCSFVLPDRSVSGEQARIDRLDEGWALVHTRGTNKTLVNDEALAVLQPRVLRDRDLVRMGAVQLLVRIPETPAPDPTQLAFPLARAWADMDAQMTCYGRLKGALDGIERTLRYCAYAALCAVRATGDPLLAKAAGEALRTSHTAGRRLTMGAWGAVAVALAQVVPGQPGDAIYDALRLLAPGARSSPLVRRLEQAVGLRNARIGHGSLQPDPAYENEARLMKQLFADLLRAVRPLARAPLVCVAQIVGFRPDRSIDYQLRWLQGSSDAFPVRPQALSAQLLADWCAVLLPDGACLSLAPFVRTSYAKEAKRTEVFFAEQLTLGPANAKVELRGVSTEERDDAELPWSLEDQRFYAAL